MQYSRLLSVGFTLIADATHRFRSHRHFASILADAGQMSPLRLDSHRPCWLRRGASHLALAWLLAQGPDVVPIPGTRRLDRIEENAVAANTRLDEGDLSRLEELVPRSGWSGNRRSFAVPVMTRSQP